MKKKPRSSRKKELNNKVKLILVPIKEIYQFISEIQQKNEEIKNYFKDKDIEVNLYEWASSTRMENQSINKDKSDDMV